MSTRAVLQTPTPAPAAVRRGASMLRVNRPGDAYEGEAERAAEKAVSGKVNRLAWSLSKVGMMLPLQRECNCGGGCDECKSKKEQMLQRDAEGGVEDAMAPPIVHEALRRPGHPLDRATRMLMESRFGHDFGGVRILRDEVATQSARSVSANAYTVGKKIVFNRGKYSPDSAAGRKLLAHELAHVVQQSGGSLQGAKLPIGGSDDAQEREARATAAIASSLSTRANAPLPRLTPAAAGLMQRDGEGDSTGPSGILDKAKYLGKDLLNLGSVSRWANSKKCLEGLFPSMVSETFNTWIPIACARTKSGTLHSREWDAFGHCWIACEGTRKCGGPQTWVLGFAREVSREWESRTGGKHHDSLTQDISNQLIGRLSSVGEGTCFSICDGLHKRGLLNLSAPEGTCIDCKNQAAGEGPCPGVAAPGASGGT